MNVTVNGRGRELPAGATLEAAVRASGAAPEQRGLAAAVDGEVVPRARWPLTELDEDQRVEVVHAVQGG